MNSKILYIIGFLFMVGIQWLIPLKMIFDKEIIVNEGIEYKFKTAPVDPNDPFRGKYISLNFEQSRIDVSNSHDWQVGNDIFITFTEDKDGFAKKEKLSKTKPAGSNYIKTNISAVLRDGIVVTYPFDRFYMEESKAQPAEDLYRKMRMDSSKNVYAVVNVLNGNAVLKDVKVDGVSITTLVESSPPVK